MLSVAVRIVAADNQTAENRFRNAVVETGGHPGQLKVALVRARQQSVRVQLGGLVPTLLGQSQVRQVEQRVAGRTLRERTTTTARSPTCALATGRSTMTATRNAPRC